VSGCVFDHSNLEYPYTFNVVVRSVRNSLERLSVYGKMDQPEAQSPDRGVGVSIGVWLYFLWIQAQLLAVGAGPVVSRVGC
jgi:hypothetical protein